MRMGGEGGRGGRVTAIVVTDLGGELLPAVGGVAAPKIEVVAAHDVDTAIALLTACEHAVLVVDTAARAFDALEVFVRCTAAVPWLESVIVVTDEAPPTPGRHPCLFVEGSDRLRLQAALRAVSDTASGSDAPSLCVDPLDLVRVAMAGRSTAGLRVDCHGRRGVLGIRAGRLVHASCGQIQGPDALYDMALCDDALAEELPAAELDALSDNVADSTGELLAAAARFKAWLADDETDCGSISDLPVSGDRGARHRLERALRERPGGVRILIACPGECERYCCHEIVAELAGRLGAEMPPCGDQREGPRFARLHPAGGGLLSLTFIPVARRHQFLFETLARSADGVVLWFPARGPDVSPWLAELPLSVPRLTIESPDPQAWGLADWLAGEVA